MKYTFSAGLMLLAGTLMFSSCERSIVVTTEEAHWEYENPDWQQIGYGDCGGNSQSPINIERHRTLVSEQLPDIQFRYSPFALKIVDNGHTLQVNNNDPAVGVNYNGTAYKFVQLHLHRASEHKIDGEGAEMELHCVHQDSLGNLMVIAFMIEEGAESPLLKQILNHVPDQKMREMTHSDVLVDLLALQPEDRAYYTYSGSLTTPPCSAAVQFLVYKKALTASRSQINEFASHYHHNARPVQPINNRIILEKK
jgi:carbonic anhydrase